MKKMISKVAGKYPFFYFSLVVIIVGYTVLYGFLHQSFLSHNETDSYTLQAIAWTHGSLSLQRNYYNLELAVFHQRYWVSFPPFPSVIMLLLLPFFGAKTPTNLISSVTTLLSFIVLYLLCRKYMVSDKDATFWSLFTVFGGNLLAISLSGAVWYQAQTMSFLLTSLSILLLISKNKYGLVASFLCWACAVGCRPFQIVFLPVYILFLTQNMPGSLIQKTRTLVVLLLPSFCILALFALYNYVRFENPFEFGHNYLPEYTVANVAQFGLGYIPTNFMESIRLPFVEGYWHVVFPRFNGFAFYIANPITICFLYRVVRNIRRLQTLELSIILCTLCSFLLTLSHKTLGGWQFGVRYIVDVFPFLLFFILLNQKKILRYESFLWFFGTILNIYGSLWLFLNLP